MSLEPGSRSPASRTIRRRAPRRSGARVLALALVIVGCARAPVAPAPARTALATPEAVSEALPDVISRPALAAAHYGEYCARCHGPGGAGDGFLAPTLHPPPTNFLAPRPRSAPSRFERAIARGVTGSAMKRFDHVLDARARWDMAFLTWSLADRPADVARGAERFAERCASCHGLPGAPGRVRLDRPVLAALAPMELAQALRARHADDDVLAAEDEAAMVAYLYTFLYTPATLDGEEATPRAETR